MACEHKHECEQCIREKIAKLEKDLCALRAKLPNVVIVKEYIPYPNFINVTPVPMPYYRPIGVVPWPTNGAAGLTIHSTQAVDNSLAALAMRN